MKALFCYTLKHLIQIHPGGRSMGLFVIMALPGQAFTDKHEKIVRQKVQKMGLEITERRGHYIILQGDAGKGKELLRRCPKLLCGLQIGRYVKGTKSS